MKIPSGRKLPTCATSDKRSTMTCSDNDPGFDVDIFSCATDDDDDGE